MKMYYKRAIENKLKELESQIEATVVYGPRQTGKSTTIKKLCGDRYDYVSLDDINARTLAINDPKLFIRTHTPPVIIDEIQYAPLLCNYIKIFIDNERFNSLESGKKRRHLFYITGSQQFDLQNSVADSLAGRVGIVDLNSLSFQEISGLESGTFDPDVDKLLKLQKEYGDLFSGADDTFDRIFKGGMPYLFSESDDIQNYFNSYVGTYIERDIKRLISAPMESQFRIFLGVLAMRTGQELNLESISGDVGVDVRTIKRWISILETTNLIKLIRPFMSNRKKRLIKTPKLYFMDTGLCAYLCGWPSATMLEKSAMAGAFYETYVVSEIVKSLSYHGFDPDMYLTYYRDKDKREIDLIYQTADRLVPIEIKKNTDPEKADKNFRVAAGLADNVSPGIVICRTDAVRPISRDVYLVPDKAIGL